MAEVSTTTLFEGGPPTRLQQVLRLEKPGDPRIARRAILVASVGWIPLAALALASDSGTGAGTAASFFGDFTTYARSLIAAPLFILAEKDCLPRLGACARHFLEAGLVRDSERKRFDHAAVSVRRLLDSQSVEILVVILAYFVTALFLRYSPAGDKPRWFGSSDSLTQLSLIEFWYVFVSRPLFLILAFGWIWRQLLWGRFLWLISKLDLRLVPSHPDQVGGLKFISSCLRGYRLLCCALGFLAAGVTANRVVHEGADPTIVKNVAIGLVIFILIFFVGPLTIFIRHLRKAKKRGMFEYGALAGAVGLQFEHKWLSQREQVDANALTVTDFSAMTDLNGVTAIPYSMKELPFGVKNVANLVLAAVVPFIPIALLAFPVKVVLKDLVKLFF